MVTATVLVVIFAPLFYVLIEKRFGKRGKSETTGSGGANRYFQVLKEKLLGKYRKGEAAGTADVTPSEDR
jgi:peptidoglycan/LPS O-acetylase OafA/YrhL